MDVVVIQLCLGAIPVLFPYQLRFTSGLSPVFLWLGLVEEGGCLGGETEVLPDLTPISPLYRFLSSPCSLAVLLGGGLWMLRPSPASSPLLVRSGLDEHRMSTDGRTADV